MRYAAFLFILAAGLNALAYNVTNQVVMTDQHGELNVEGVASVQDIASNSVKVAIAEQKAQVAQQTSVAVSNAIDGVVGNIMSNNVVIYRSGFTDAFQSLVIFTESDILAIYKADFSQVGSSIVVNVKYVCTANLGTTKPLAFVHNTCVAKEEYDQVPDSDITTPVYHAESVVYQGQTFAGYYSTTITINNPVGTASYFLWIKADGDTPSGEGTTLDLPNGVKGGATKSEPWGGYLFNFEGGVLRSYQEEN